MSLSLSGRKQIKGSKFFNYLGRLKWITRWGLMRSSDRENVMEHSWEVAVIAHALAIIKNQYFDGEADANAIATAALYHDVSEVLTGDLPTPIKYHSKSITEAYQRIEAEAEDELISLLPEELRGVYVLCFKANKQPQENREIIKAADTISAHIKCLAEIESGNNEFSEAAQFTLKRIVAFNLPEVDYFMDHFMVNRAMTMGL